MKSSIKNLEDRQKPQAQEKQRETMTNVNDLALMLEESMEQMQQQMSGMMSGSQMCNKPGGAGGKPGNVPMDKIIEGQQGLNGDMQKMGEKGSNDGKGKEGDGKGEEGKDGNSAKDFAQAAAKQAALRKALEEIQQQKSEHGEGYY